MEKLLTTTVEKIILDPYKHLKTKDIDMENVDPG